MSVKIFNDYIQGCKRIGREPSIKELEYFREIYKKWSSK